MVDPTLTPEAILTSLTRIVHPGYGVDVVNLGTIYGIELHGDFAKITMAHATNGDPAHVEQLIREGLFRRHPDLATVEFEISHDPPWRDDFITAEGELQLSNPMPANPDFTVTEDAVRDSLMHVIDPEVGVNVVDLGLVYGIAVNEPAIDITMTLTTPGCPLHDTIEAAIQRVIETRHPSITDIRTHLVWEPAWDTDMISDAGRRALGW